MGLRAPAGRAPAGLHAARQGHRLRAIAPAPACLQVEFGAHQVLLVRSQECKARLPPPLDASTAIVLTVPQAKGLEFTGGRDAAVLLVGDAGMGEVGRRRIRVKTLALQC